MPRVDVDIVLQLEGKPVGPPAKVTDPVGIVSSEPSVLVTVILQVVVTPP